MLGKYCPNPPRVHSRLFYSLSLQESRGKSPGLPRSAACVAARAHLITEPLSAPRSPSGTRRPRGPLPLRIAGCLPACQRACSPAHPLPSHPPLLHARTRELRKLQSKSLKNKIAHVSKHKAAPPEAERSLGDSLEVFRESQKIANKRRMGASPSAPAAGTWCSRPGGRGSRRATRYKVTPSSVCSRPGPAAAATFSPRRLPEPKRKSFLGADGKILLLFLFLSFLKKKFFLVCLQAGKRIA